MPVKHLRSSIDALRTDVGNVRAMKQDDPDYEKGRALLRELSEGNLLGIRKSRSMMTRVLMGILFFFLPSFVSMLSIIYVSESWEASYPSRPLEVRAFVERWDDGTRILIAHYPPIDTRRCASIGTHWLERETPGNPLERFALKNVNNGGAPVDEQGNVIPVPFDLSFVIPRGFPDGEWLYTSSQSTQCEVLPGVVRFGHPLWTNPTPVNIPPEVKLK
jgi:hypothetical protein